jgi:hypothetical protein
LILEEYTAKGWWRCFFLFVLFFFSTLEIWSTQSALRGIDLSGWGVGHVSHHRLILVEACSEKEVPFLLLTMS